jgi:hypothetical protein
MAFDKFDIIGALEAYAISKGWHFVYGFNKFESNIAVMNNYTPSQMVLIADFKAEPKYSGANIGEITYTCLMMLGRKFDANGIQANLDETMMQKYDRRLKDLAYALALFIADFKCKNELELISAPISVDINVFDTNIDFAICENAIFVQ